MIELNCSGLTTRYQSALTDVQDQALATGLLIGTRLPPSPMMRLADWWPTDVQDLIPFDGLFRVIIFAGDISSSLHAERLTQFSESLLSPSANRKDPDTKIWTVTILSGNKERLLWTEVPKSLKDRNRCGTFIQGFDPYIEDRYVGFLLMKSYVRRSSAERYLKRLGLDRWVRQC